MFKIIEISPYSIYSEQSGTAMITFPLPQDHHNCGLKVTGFLYVQDIIIKIRSDKYFVYKDKISIVCIPSFLPDSTEMD